MMMMMMITQEIYHSVFNYSVFTHKLESTRSL